MMIFGARIFRRLEETKNCSAFEKRSAIVCKKLELCPISKQKKDTISFFAWFYFYDHGSNKFRINFKNLSICLF